MTDATRDPGPNPYEVLGVRADADAREIRTAFARLVRQVSAEKEPERFQEIREAYEILRDPHRRGQWDAYAAHRREVEILFARVGACLDADRCDEAMDLLDELLELLPGHVKSLTLLAKLACDAGELARAERAARRLAEVAPHDSESWRLLAHCLSAAAWETKRAEGFQEAIACLDRALEKDPDRLDCILEKVRLLEHLGRPEELEQTLHEAWKRSMSAGQPDARIGARLVFLRLSQGRPEGVLTIAAEIARRVRSLPEGSEERARAAALIASVAKAALDRDFPTLAERCAVLADTLVPRQDEIQELLAASRAAARAQEALRARAERAAAAMAMHVLEKPKRRPSAVSRDSTSSRTAGRPPAGRPEARASGQPDETTQHLETAARPPRRKRVWILVLILLAIVAIGKLGRSGGGGWRAPNRTRVERQAPTYTAPRTTKPGAAPTTRGGAPRTGPAVPRLPEVGRGSSPATGWGRGGGVPTTGGGSRSSPSGGGSSRSGGNSSFGGGSPSGGGGASFGGGLRGR